MQVGARARYAVMALVDLASRGDVGPVALAEIARRQEISVSYLEQLFARLRKGGLVRSVRGPGGGYMLAHPADSTRIAEIIAAVDRPAKSLKCAPAAPACCRNSPTQCRTHPLWESLGEQVYRYLSSVSVADIRDGRLGVPAESGLPVGDGTADRRTGALTA